MGDIKDVNIHHVRATLHAVPSHNPQHKMLYFSHICSIINNKIMCLAVEYICCLIRLHTDLRPIIDLTLTGIRTLVVVLRGTNCLERCYSFSGRTAILYFKQRISVRFARNGPNNANMLIDHSRKGNSASCQKI